MRPLAALLALALASPGAAAPSAGSSVFEFLSLDSDARSAALGGAYTALALDANALRYNPAGLALSRRHQAALMHNAYFQGLSQQHLGYASTVGWGLSLTRFSFGDVKRTSLTDPDGTSLGSTGMTSLAVEAGYGRALSEAWSAGVGVKMIRETIDRTTAKGFAADLGALYRSPRFPLSLGLALRNLGPSTTFLHADEALPWEARAGAAFGVPLWGATHTLTADFSKKRGGALRGAAGVEVMMDASVPLRVGYQTGNEAGSGLALGLGWGRPDLRVDYAFVPFGDLGHAHRVSLALAWGGDAPARPQRAAAPAGEAAVEVDLAETVEEHLERGRSLFGRRDWAGASAHWQAALEGLAEGDGRVIEVLERLGASAVKLGQIDVAHVHYHRALVQAERRGVKDIYALAAYLGRAHCWEAVGRTEDAAQDYRSALRLNPDERTRQAVERKLAQLEGGPSSGR